MFDQLTDRFNAIFAGFGNKKLTESNIQDGVREVRRALLEADVNIQVVKTFTDKVQQAALGEKVIRSVKPADMFVKVVHDQLVSVMGGEGSPLKLKKASTSILLCGLQGSGKTTTAAKIAKYYKDQYRFLLVSTDIYRPAAMEQLKIMAEQAGVAFFDEALKIRKPLDIVRKAKQFALKNGYNGLIVDTAGRLEIDDEMMDELARLNKIIDFDEVFFVADATAGQVIAETVQAFHNTVELTGLVLTKFDSDTRGGAALSVRAVTGKPILFTGTGEKIDDLEIFYPERVASRILGRGDILSFIENAQQMIEEEDAAKLEKKIKKNEFDLADFRDQLKNLRKMGSLSKLMEMLPGGQAMTKQGMDEKQLIRAEAIINSMTPFERKNTKIINPNRQKRIAAGSGTTVRDVTQLLNRFQNMKKMMKKISKNKGFFDKFGGNGFPEDFSGAMGVSGQGTENSPFAGMPGIDKMPGINPPFKY